MSEAERPKLIIDGDWKRDAQVEKDRLGAKPAAAGGAGGSGGAGAAGGAGGLEVDQDWKSQAQAEKARLADAEKAKSESAGGAGGAGAAGAGGAGARGLPPADFGALVGTLVTNALMYLGAFPDEMGRAMVSLEHARFHIDLIQVLAEKVKGNVSAEEADDLAQALNELRLRYVEITQAVARAAAKQKAGGAAGVGGAAGLGGLGGMGGLGSSGAGGAGGAGGLRITP